MFGALQALIALVFSIIIFLTPLLIIGLQGVATAAVSGTIRDIGTVRDDPRPWWRGGFETTKRTQARMAKVAAWILTELAQNTSGSTDDDTVVVMVAHGGVIAKLTNLLCHAAFTGTSQPQPQPLCSTDGVRNTSVTSICLPSRAYGYDHDLPNSSGTVDKYLAKIDFFNSTDHLGNEQNRLWASRTQII